MVNRTGQGMRAPKLPERSSVSAVVPSVQINQITSANPSAGQGFKAFAQVLNNFENQIDERLDIQAETEGLRAGAIAGQEGVPDLKDAATIRGRAYNHAARNAASLEFDMNSRLMLAEIQEKHGADPVSIKSKSRAYLNGVLPQLQAYDPAMAQQFEANYILRETAAIKSAAVKRDAIARDRQMEKAFRLRLSLQDELSADAAAFISGDESAKQDVLLRMTNNAARLTDIATQIGADGRPLFSARERVMAERSAQDAVAKSIGAAWFNAQDDLLAGYKTWEDGNATVTVKDAEGYLASVNIKDLVGARVYEDVKSDYVEKLRAEISFENQVDALEQRRFDKNADQIFTDLSALSQDAPLPLTVAEAVKSQLKPDQYLTLRALAKKQSPSVSDGAVLQRLTVQDLEGQDIRDAARVEYEGGNLTQEDFIGLYKNNVARMAGGAKSPIVVGRELLSQNLGTLSKELGIAQSATIGQAVTEYEIEIADFVTENQRQPTPREARDIAESLSQRFSVMEVDNALFALPLPQSISQSEKNSKTLTSSDVQQKIKFASQSYLEKNNGDVEQRDNDPEYIREVVLLKKYYERLMAKEQARQNTGGMKDGR